MDEPRYYFRFLRSAAFPQIAYRLGENVANRKSRVECDFVVLQHKLNFGAELISSLV